MFTAGDPPAQFWGQSPPPVDHSQLEIPGAEPQIPGAGAEPHMFRPEPHIPQMIPADTGIPAALVGDTSSIAPGDTSSVTPQDAPTSEQGPTQEGSAQEAETQEVGEPPEAKKPKVPAIKFNVS